MTDLAKIFKDKFGSVDGAEAFRAPGRVNLIGEHTDYNDGFVFPAAVSLEVSALARPRNDGQLRIWSEDFRQSAEWDLKDLTKSDKSWVNYVKAVISEMPPLKTGFDAVFSSALPVGSGLSSSAAVELLNCFILSAFNGLAYDAKNASLVCQKAENNFIGVKCGIMDQFAVALGRKDSALFLDTRSLDYSVVPLSLGDNRIVISNTNKPRTLAGSAYNQRRSECESAVSAIRTKEPGVKALRDVSTDLLAECRSAIDPTAFRRARHVVEEDERVLESVKALDRGDLRRFGILMNASHESLRDLYEVSCKELDVLVEEARKIPGTLGSRMTGAGFGGCTVSLVRKDSIGEFQEKVGEAYHKRTGLAADFYVAESVDGAGRV
jgi:galactokinase